MSGPAEGHLVPRLYPNLSLRGTTLCFLGWPERDLGAGLARVLERCDGTRTAAEIGDDAALDALRRLGCVILVGAPVPAEAPATLVVSPHMDDAFLSLGGTALASGTALHVVDVFGLDPWIKPDTPSTLTPARRTAVRRREEAFAAGVAGCRVSVWEHPSAPQRGYSGWRSPVDWTRDGTLARRIADDLHALVEKDRYERVLLPLGVGGHTDHRLLRAVGCRLVPHLGRVREVAFYEDLPYAALRRHWRRLETCPRVASRPVYRDISAQVDGKVALLRTYSSQLSFFEPEAVRGYHARDGMRTGVPSIDRAHERRRPRLAPFNERLWPAVRA